MIKNFYTLTKKKKIRNPHYDIHGIELPCYMLIIGGSGSGKTNVLMQFLSLTTETFDNIVICTRNKDEPLYNLLQEKIPDITFYENEIPSIEDFNGSKMSLICFDDLVLDKQLNNQIQEYYIRARKKNITCIYLSQSYYKIPKLIRINARYIIIKKLASLKDLKLIISEYSLDNVDNILSLYKEATQQFTDFLLIDVFNNSFKKNFTSI
jgi:type IV secretory pathway VirB4 component